MCHRQENCLMTIPYRIRRTLQHTAIALGILFVLGVVAMSAWVLWLNRFVIYTDDGAKLDFNLSFNHSGGVIAHPPAQGPDVNISYGDTDELLKPSEDVLQKFEGVVVTGNMFESLNYTATKEALDALPAGSTVLLDVRNARGEFFYQSSLGRNAEKVHGASVSKMIARLKEKDCYLIARFPAFRDRWYILADEYTRVPYGLPHAVQSYSLWEDKSIQNLSHFWLNPASSGTQNFLVQIVTELRAMGFDEVVFSDFRYPDTDQVIIPEDHAQILSDVAATLVRSCATDSFTVSFTGTDFTLPQGRSRLYLENVAAADIPFIVASLDLEDPTTQLVFYTEHSDTRFTDYSVLRSLKTSG